MVLILLYLTVKDKIDAFRMWESIKCDIVICLSCGRIKEARNMGDDILATCEDLNDIYYCSVYRIHARSY